MRRIFLTTVLQTMLGDSRGHGVVHQRPGHHGAHHVGPEDDEREREHAFDALLQRVGEHELHGARVGGDAHQEERRLRGAGVLHAAHGARQAAPVPHRVAQDGGGGQVHVQTHDAPRFRAQRAHLLLPSLLGAHGASAEAH